MPRFRIARSLLLGLMVLLGGRALGQTPLSWESLPTLFAERFRERSPEGHDAEGARLREAISSGFRFDPQVAGSWSQEENTEGWRAKVSQKGPLGASLSASTSTSEGTPPAYEVRLQQELLKGGPAQSLASERLARHTESQEILAAEMNRSLRMKEALQAFLDAGLFERRKQLSQERLARARAGYEEVRKAVESGHKAKADLLVYEAAFIRAELALEESLTDAARIRRDLAKSLWQRETDGEIAPAFDVFPEPWRKRLEDISWPQEPPSVKLARLKGAAAQARSDVATHDSLPALAVWGSLGWKDSSPKRQSYGLELAFPLVSLWTREEAREAALKAESALATLADAQNAARALVSTHAEALKTLESRLQASEKLLALSRRTAEIQKQKYEDGKSTIQELQRAEDDVSEAETALETARAELIRRLLTRAHDAGTLLASLGTAEKS